MLRAKYAISTACRLRCRYIPSLQQGLIDQIAPTAEQKEHDDMSPSPITYLAGAQTHR